VDLSANAEGSKCAHDAHANRDSKITALRSARLFNTSERFWMNLQATYDLQSAADAGGKQIAKIQPIIGVAA
jgi:plasmid maintenance system antidote protein VapI